MQNQHKHISWVGRWGVIMRADPIEQNWWGPVQLEHLNWTACGLPTQWNRTIWSQVLLSATGVTKSDNQAEHQEQLSYVNCPYCRVALDAALEGKFVRVRNLGEFGT